jgi:hypothetical protein
MRQTDGYHLTAARMIAGLPLATSGRPPPTLHGVDQWCGYGSKSTRMQGRTQFADFLDASCQGKVARSSLISSTADPQLHLISEPRLPRASASSTYATPSGRPVPRETHGLAAFPPVPGTAGPPRGRVRRPALQQRSTRRQWPASQRAGRPQSAGCATWRRGCSPPQWRRTARRGDGGRGRGQPR